METTGAGGAVGDGGDAVQEQQQEAADGKESRARESDPCASVDLGVADPNSDPADSGTAAEDSEKSRTSSGNEGGGDEHRATEPVARARVPVGAVGSISEPLDPSMAVGGFVVTGGNFGDAGSSGVGGDDAEPSQTPPRDSAKGKGAVVEEEQTTEARESPVRYREADIAFRPPATVATSSRHVPTTFDDVAENAPDGVVARLLEEYPALGEMVLRAKEERAQAIAAWDAAARA
ncbi:hypothetical protein RHMOL_Rhmol10G0163400 [Rhododendron molle]|uniref:Uncharacterized protein n=1 Tax=Rhododendron molle TaxID=49168 RepID=A0ACC0M2S9_RHOML|nr:hypothetical protein RHMOL_Rhmol10G0163400 [Rhododendron molle]